MISSQSVTWDIDFGHPFRRELDLVGCSDGVEDFMFTVTEDGSVTDVDVRLAIRQEYAYEIIARLDSPTGKEAILVKYQNAEVPDENGKHFQEAYLDDVVVDSINSGVTPNLLKFGTEHQGSEVQAVAGIEGEEFVVRKPVASNSEFYRLIKQAEDVRIPADW